MPGQHYTYGCAFQLTKIDAGYKKVVQYSL